MMQKLRVNKKVKVVRVIAPGFRPKETVLKGLRDFFKLHPEFEFKFDRKIITTHPMNAADEITRIQSLISAIQDESIDIIWCLRGGYGAIQLLEALSKIKKPKKKKLLIGLSDITSLHLFLNQKWGWSSLHASHIDRWVENKVSTELQEENYRLIFPILGTDKVIIEYNKLKAINLLAKNAKKVSAEIVGGNLMTLTSHTGTPYQIDLKGRFLFFEEIGERAYRIDRCLMQLYLAGVFKGCRGVFIGQMTQCLEPDGKNLLPWLWQQWGEKLKIPLFQGIETGHDLIQRPLPLGSRAILKKRDDQFQLSVEYKL